MALSSIKNSFRNFIVPNGKSDSAPPQPQSTQRDSFEKKPKKTGLWAKMFARKRPSSIELPHLDPITLTNVDSAFLNAGNEKAVSNVLKELVKSQQRHVTTQHRLLQLLEKTKKSSDYRKMTRLAEKLAPHVKTYIRGEFRLLSNLKNATSQPLHAQRESMVKALVRHINKPEICSETINLVQQFMDMNQTALKPKFLNESRIFEKKSTDRRIRRQFDIFKGRALTADAQENLISVISDIQPSFSKKGVNGKLKEAMAEYTNKIPDEQELKSLKKTATKANTGSDIPALLVTSVQRLPRLLMLVGELEKQHKKGNNPQDQVLIANHYAPVLKHLGQAAALVNQNL